MIRSEGCGRESFYFPKFICPINRYPCFDRICHLNLQIKMIYGRVKERKAQISWTAAGE